MNVQKEQLVDQLTEDQLQYARAIVSVFDELEFNERKNDIPPES